MALAGRKATEINNCLRANAFSAKTFLSLSRELRPFAEGYIRGEGGIQRKRMGGNARAIGLSI